MVSEIKLYVEGGGKHSSKRATIKFQQGFDAFLKELKDAARDKRISFRVIPSADSQSTYHEFMRSVENSPQSFSLLLVDSDAPLAEDEKARAFLQSKHKKWKLQKIADEQCHLMVQIMESWFLADVDALKNFYGQNFRENAIPKNRNVEAIEKGKVEKALEAATAKTQKGEYKKIEHGTKILEIISAEKVRAAAFYCRELFIVISKAME